MLPKAPAGSAQETAGEKENIRTRIEVVGQDSYSSRTGQKGKRYVESASPQTVSRKQQGLVQFQGGSVEPPGPDGYDRLAPSNELSWHCAAPERGSRGAEPLDHHRSHP